MDHGAEVLSDVPVPHAVWAAAVAVAASVDQAGSKAKKGKRTIFDFVLFLFYRLFQLLAVVNVVPLCRSEILFEVGDAGLYQDVIPLDEFLDV